MALYKIPTSTMSYATPLIRLPLIDDFTFCIKASRFLRSSSAASAGGVSQGPEYVAHTDLCLMDHPRLALGRDTGGRP